MVPFVVSNFLQLNNIAAETKIIREAKKAF
jgi:hypothetical protein